MDRVSANPACYGHRNATMILIAYRRADLGVAGILYPHVTIARPRRHIDHCQYGCESCPGLSHPPTRPIKTG